MAEMEEYGLLERLLREQCHVGRHGDGRPGADDDDASEGKAADSAEGAEGGALGLDADASRSGGDLQWTQG